MTAPDAQPSGRGSGTGSNRREASRRPAAEADRIRGATPTTGLSSDEATRRPASHGPDEPRGAAAPGAAAGAAAAARPADLVPLVGAAALTSATGDLSDAAVIPFVTIVIIVNAVVGVVAMPCHDAGLEPPPDGSTEWSALGDPTEAAPLVAAARLGLDRAAPARELPRVEEIPFDSDRKRRTTIRRLDGGVGIAPRARRRLRRGARPAR